VLIEISDCIKLVGELQWKVSSEGMGELAA